MKNSIKRIVALRGEPRRRLATARNIHELVSPLFVGLDREHLWRIDLDSRNGLLGAELVSVGTVDRAPCHPREVFGPAMVARASRIVLVHNHPSGNLEPSTSDRKVMWRLRLCGLITGIEIADYLIVHDGNFYSQTEARQATRGNSSLKPDGRSAQRRVVQ
jgi:DNA repair protein RadC